MLKVGEALGTKWKRVQVMEQMAGVAPAPMEWIVGILPQRKMYEELNNHCLYLMTRCWSHRGNIGDYVGKMFQC